MLGAVVCESITPNSTPIKDHATIPSSLPPTSIIPSSQDLSALKIASEVSAMIVALITIGILVLQFRKMKGGNKVYELA